MLSRGRLSLGLLDRLVLGGVGLLAQVLEDLAPLRVRIVGDLLDECFLAVGQLELGLDGLIVGQHHQVSTWAAGAAERRARRSLLRRDRHRVDRAHRRRLHDHPVAAERSK